MKLAISNIAWLPEENDRVLDVIQHHGIDGIEVAPTLLFDDPADASTDESASVRDFYNRKGLAIIAMQALLFGHPELCIFESETSREKTISYLEKIIGIAGQLGVAAMVFGSPKNRQTRGVSSGKIDDISRSFFRTIGDIALQHNSTFCIEPNATDYGCDFVTNTDEAVDLVRQVDHPGFGLHMDAGVMTLNNESYERALEKAMPYMKHFHISEPYLNRITENATDHSRVGRALRSLNYDGWVSIEMRNNLGEDNVQVVDECLTFAKKHYLS
jgi:sugar phosphate isomerase/epimerase